MSCPTDRRTASQPLPQRRVQHQAAVAAPQGAQCQCGSGELAAALSRRLMIVEGVASGGGMVASGAMKVADAPSGSSLQYRTSCAGPSSNAMRMMKAHLAGAMAQSAASCSFGAAGAPPPPTNGAGSARFSVAMSATSAHATVPAGVRHPTAWTPLNADRVQQRYVRQDTQQGVCTPIMGGGPPSAPSPTFGSGAASPIMGGPAPGSVPVEYMVQRFGRLSAPAGASGSPHVSPVKGTPRRMDDAIPVTMSTPLRRDDSSRGWRTNRDPFELQTQESLSARLVRRDTAPHLTNSPIGELSDLKQELGIYVDLANREKLGRHEAVTAQRTAEQRAEAAEARLAQLEEKLASAERNAAAFAAFEADKLRLEARNASLEKELTALRSKAEMMGKLGDTLQRSNSDFEMYRNQIQEEVAARNRMDTEMALIRQDKRMMAEELKQLQAERAAEQAERAGEQQRKYQLEKELKRIRTEHTAAHEELADARRAKKALAEELQQATQEKQRLQSADQCHAEELRKKGQEYQELLEVNRALRCQVQEIAVAGLRAGGRTPPSTPISSPSPSAAAAKSLSEAVAQQSPLASGGTTSESRLRAALARGGATSTDELGEAIAAVEAMLGEAKRELQSRRLRERRAAYEALHSAEASGDEDMLAQAVAEARRTNVDNEEIDKAETILEKLRSLSQEERAAKDAAKRRAKNKEQAFLFVKRDDATALRALIESVGAEEEAAQAAPGPRWPDWKDHAGRTLLRCSVELRSQGAEGMLRSLLESQAPNLPRATSGRGVSANEVAALKSPERSPALHSQASFGEGEGDIVLEARPPAKAPRLPNLGGARERSPEQKARQPTGIAPETTPEEPIKDEAELRAKAFRAVVKDDTQALAEVIVDRVPSGVWSEWQNKAGKDLLTLSEERGSSAAYSLIAKALGLLKERKRETFEEREAVWVLLNGEVQPRRATVMEDTPEEADEVFLEYWEGDEPACRVDRHLVLKACN